MTSGTAKKSGLVNFVSGFANQMAQRLDLDLPVPVQQSPVAQRQWHVPHNLDLTYITERIIAAPRPADAPHPTYNDLGRDVLGSAAAEQNAAPQHDGRGSTMILQEQEQLHPEIRSNPSSGLASQPKHDSGVNPGTLSTFLERRHGQRHFLAFNLSDQMPDDRTLLLLHRQILHCTWVSPCRDRTETPCLSPILHVCYALHAYLSLDRRNVALVYCQNGRTRSAIVVACYLKFAHIVHSSLDGFSLFLKRRCPDLVTEEDDQQPLSMLPPSLQTFFYNFDSCVELGRYSNPKPVLLRAVALQGVPVDDKPCIDIWDSQQRHIYSSHHSIEENAPVQTSQWADEEGFYRVNKVLRGDFVLLCRFGGPYASDDSHDPSKVLFRYANTSGFLGSGPYELPKCKVDMMRRYVTNFDPDDFLLTLMFESYWDCTGSEEEVAVLSEDCPADILPPVLTGVDALECGFRFIAAHHAATPLDEDVASLKSVWQEDLRDCPPSLVSLALQMMNYDRTRARNLLCEGAMQTWWKTTQLDGERTTPIDGDDFLVAETTAAVSMDEKVSKQSTSFESSDPVIDEGCLEVLRILDRAEGIKPNGSSLIAKAVKDDDVTGRIRSSIDEPYLPYQPILFTNRGDIVDGFGTSLQGGRRRYKSRKLTVGSRPLLPMHRRKRQRHQYTEVEIEPRTKRRIASQDDPFQRIGRFPGPYGANGDLSYDPDFLASMQLFLQMRHTGVSLQDLMALLKASRRWNDPEPIQACGNVSVAPDSVGVCSQRVPGSSTGDSDAPSTHAKSEPATAGISAPGPEEKVDSPVGVDASSKQSNGQTTEAGAVVAETSVDGAPGNDLLEGSDEPAEGNVMGLKVETPGNDNPEAKKENVAPEQPLSDKTAQTEGEPESDDTKPTSSDIPLREDPEYSKYFRMRKMGLPLDAVQHALKRDGKDPGIMDLDPEKSLKSQKPSESPRHDNEPALKDDPEYSKYFRMLSVGLPMGAVRNSLQRDGKDPGIMDLDPNKSLKSQTAGNFPEKEHDGPALKDDPEYSKYFRMLSVGLPMGAVRNSLQRDGKDPNIMDLDPNKSLKSQTAGGASEEKDDGPALKDDPEFSKYFRMLAMGLPLDAVKHALQRDGKEPSIMDLDHCKSLKSQTKTDAEDTGVPLEEDPEYSKYFKMLKMRLPMGAVKNALQRDGKDPSIMDLDPKKSVASQVGQRGGPRIVRKEKKRVRRKKIYWTPIDPGKLNEESIWSLVRGSVVMDQLKYDPKEFENLFTESSNPAEKKKKAASGGGDKASQSKKSVQIIDGKRGMNGGIILARVKRAYSKIADMVDEMDSGEFDAVQLKALKEFLATDEEKSGLQAYLKKAEGSEESVKAAMANLSECEKYMVAMMKVQDAAAKFDCMLFEKQFKSRLDELMTGVNTVKSACDEVRASERLRKMMAMILVLVNEINTGGDGNLAVGFSLDALLKLNEAKAFDKKTSVLQYLVKLVKENDPTLIDFRHDIGSVPDAEGVILDSLVSDAKSLRDELEKVKATAQNEAERFEQEGKLRKRTLAELCEQRTEVRQISGLPHYNKVDHISGRTSMERFTLRAAALMEGADTAISNLKSTYAGLLEYFGEDEKMASNAFFGTMKKFILEFNNAVEYVEKVEKAKLREKMRAAAKAAGAAKRLARMAKSAIPSAEKKPSLGDVAAVVAMKAKAKLESQQDRDSGVQENSQSDGVNDGFQSEKGRTEKADSDKIAKGTTTRGGIAALAAAAGRLKQQESTDESKDAQLVAMKRSTEEPGEPVVGHMKGGGIAAMAAAAALARSKEKDTPKSAESHDTASKKTDTPSILGGGGIAAAAAAAARLKQQESTGAAKNVDVTVAEKSIEDPGHPSVVGPMGDSGIAAMAAAAARTRGRKQESHRSADTKDRNSKSDVAPSMFGGGGIAAAAAAAARSKQKEFSDGAEEAAVEESAKETGRSPLAGPIGGGGIAAMAAAAALARVNKKVTRKPVESEDRISKGADSKSMLDSAGVATAAAAAAVARRKQQMSTDTSMDAGLIVMDECAEKPGHPPAAGPIGAGGIAAVAAAAALARGKKKDTGKPVESADSMSKQAGAKSMFSGGGIAAAAAAAAAARAKQQERADSVDTPETTKDMLPEGSGRTPVAGAMGPGGIAAMAVAAALARGQKNGTRKSAKTEDNTSEGADSKSMPAGGGIAAAAAAAARLKQQKSIGAPKDAHLADAARSTEESGHPPVARQMEGGEIAEMAAATAHAREKNKDAYKPVESEDSMSKQTGATSMFSGGGIAAAAAASAARLKQQESTDTSRDADLSEINMSLEEPGQPFVARPMEGSGIAAMAAAAAIARSKKKGTLKSEESQDTASKGTDTPSMLDGGGIAVAAAAAAAARLKRQETDGAAKNAKVALEEESTKDPGHPPVARTARDGSIAAMAAAAALSRSAKKDILHSGDSDSKDDVAPSLLHGGTIAFASTSELQKKSKCTRDVDVKEESTEGAGYHSAAGPMGVSGIAAMAAAAALVRGTKDSRKSGESESSTSERTGATSVLGGGGTAAEASDAEAHAAARWRHKQSTNASGRGNQEDCGSRDVEFVDTQASRGNGKAPVARTVLENNETAKRLRQLLRDGYDVLQETADKSDGITPVEESHDTVSEIISKEYAVDDQPATSGSDVERVDSTKYDTSAEVCISTIESVPKLEENDMSVHAYSLQDDALSVEELADLGFKHGSVPSWKQQNGQSGSASRDDSCDAEGSHGGERETANDETRIMGRSLDSSDERSRENPLLNFLKHMSPGSPRQRKTHSPSRHEELPPPPVENTK